MDDERLRQRLEDIRPILERELSRPPVHRESDLQALWRRLRDNRKLPQSVTFRSFLSQLLESWPVTKIRIPLPHRPETRYLWRDVSPLVFALSLKPDSYLSHFSAMAFHELTTQIPKTIYVNAEQRPQPSNPHSLTQESIDRAFSRPQRLSSNTAAHGNVRFVFINGKHTGQLQVMNVALPTGEDIRVTSLCRTLIDIAVRPAYSGGVARVLEAYENAVDQLDAQELAETLHAMNYAYPYHQAIGYYLERAGAPAALTEPFARLPREFDFYIAHGIQEKQFNKRWRLWIPKSL